jgi:hypothetical protein
MKKPKRPKNDKGKAQSPDFFVEDDGSQELNDFLRGLDNLIARHNPGTGHLPFAQLLNAIRVILKHQSAINKERSDPLNPVTIAKLKDMILNMKKGFEDITLKMFSENVELLEKEGDIIASKKQEFSEKGIRLRVYQKYHTTILTAAGQMKYQRMALRPSFPEDKSLLGEIGVKGYVFPLDDALGLSRLPFKITIEAMLIMAKEASLRKSYEATERSLKESTLITANDDTIRAVTNTVGGLVHANDLRIASVVWDKFNNGRLVSPETKINHTLYLHCHGVKIPIRPENANVSDGQLLEREEDDKKKGVIWKENKLGMAFSTDNIRYWTDKDGKQKQCIKKREYTGLIGTSRKFSKLMLSLALRNGYGAYKNTVLISDGATWIRKMKDECFQDAIMILDYSQLCAHIHAFAKEIYDEKKFETMAETLAQLFRCGKSEEALEIIRGLPKRQLAKDNSDFLQYIESNKDNIDYVAYKRQGFFIACPSLASDNGHVPKRPMKQGGMRWNIENAQAVLSLDAKRRSGLWESDVAALLYNHYAHVVKNENLDRK